MSGYKAHLTAAFLLGMVFNYFVFGVPEIEQVLLDWSILLPHFLVILGALLGGIFPDIDSQSSKMNWLAEVFIGLFIVGSIYFGKEIYALFAGIILVGIQFLKHRGFMHGAVVLGGFSILIAFIEIDFAIGFSIGWISHLALDRL